MRNSKFDIFGVVKYSLGILCLLGGISPPLSWADHSEAAPILRPAHAALLNKDKALPLNGIALSNRGIFPENLQISLIHTAEYLNSPAVSSPFFTQKKEGVTQSLLAGVAWIDKILAPAYQWVRNMRGLSASKAQQKINNSTWLEKDKLNRVISYVLNQYQGTVLSIKPLKLEPRTFRIKMLADSGEVKILNYSEERGKFIQMDKEERHANTVN